MKILHMDHDKVLSLLPDREPDSNKFDFGRILLLCGSRGYTGAAVLAAMGALRCGSGLVYVGVPESIYSIVATKLTEAVVFPLPDEGGKLSFQAVAQLEELLPKMDAVLIGPGLGRGSSVEKVVMHVLQTFQGPAVLDADGINAICAHKDILRGRTGLTVLTPHMGEFIRLGGSDSEDRKMAAVEMARDLHQIVLLKGHRTVITDADAVYVNQTGNPGMAVGGSGDILAGMITSFLGQGLSALDAAAASAWLHGAAGDICAREIGQYGMLPTDMIQVLPRLLK